MDFACAIKQKSTKPTLDCAQLLARDRGESIFIGVNRQEQTRGRIRRFLAKSSGKGAIFSSKSGYFKLIAALTAKM